MFSPTTKDAAMATASDAKTTAYSAKNDLRNASQDATGDLARSAAKAGRKIRLLVDSASDHISEATDVVTGEIRSNPVRSSLVALGAGFVLGALLRRI